MVSRKSNTVPPGHPDFRIPPESFNTLLGFLEILNTPRSLTVYILAKNKEWKQIFELGLPDVNQDTDKFRRDYAATKWLSKIDGVDSGIDTTAAAMRAFVEYENLCGLTNVQFARRFGELGVETDTDAARQLSRVREKISEILGPLPDIKFLLSNCTGFTPGATSSCSRGRVSKARKYAAELHTTGRALSVSQTTLAYFDLWGQAALKADGPLCALASAFTRVRGSKLSFVLKNAKTKRGICTEPHVLTLIQRAYGNYLVGRLKKFNVDLSDQGVNVRLARMGSITDTISTIDLKGASDCIALGLVQHMLPPDWFDALNCIRSHFVELPSERGQKPQYLRLEKFSSMGNGFTFELESVIFLGAVLAQNPGVYAVYGDDLIIDSTCTPPLLDTLKVMGFIPNKDKTFVHGPFRESCGGDFHRGVNVTPPYLRKFPRTTFDWVQAHNQIREFFGSTGFLTREESAFLRRLRRLVPGSLGCRGYADSVYHVNFDEALPRLNGRWSKGNGHARYSETSGFEGYAFKAYTPNPVRDLDALKNEYAVLATALGPARPDSVTESTVLRRRYVWRLRTVIAIQWHDLIVI